MEHLGAFGLGGEVVDNLLNEIAHLKADGGHREDCLLAIHLFGVYADPRDLLALAVA